MHFNSTCTVVYQMKMFECVYIITYVCLTQQMLGHFQYPISATVCVCVCVCSIYIYIYIYIYIIFYVNCFGRTMLYMCIEYHI